MDSDCMVVHQIMTIGPAIGYPRWDGWFPMTDQMASCRAKDNIDIQLIPTPHDQVASCRRDIKIITNCREDEGLDLDRLLLLNMLKKVVVSPLSDPTLSNLKTEKRVRFFGRCSLEFVSERHDDQWQMMVFEGVNLITCSDTVMGYWLSECHPDVLMRLHIKSWLILI